MEREQIWSIYFAGIASIKNHPRNEGNNPSIAYCARIADAMMLEHFKRFPPGDDKHIFGEEPWHG